MKAKMSCAFDSKQRTNLRVVLVVLVDKQPDSTDSHGWNLSKNLETSINYFKTVKGKQG